MRFFTPDLYRQFNSPDDDEADRANEAWEAALHNYQRHLDSIRGGMPSQVRKVAELCLHDAELLGFDQEVQSFFPEPLLPIPLWSALAILSLKHEGSALSLIYFLWDNIREHAASDNWPFSKLGKHWLYDELDLASGSRGMFVHRVLFSDGSVLEIPFHSVISHSFPLPASDGSTVARQSA